MFKFIGRKVATGRWRSKALLVSGFTLLEIVIITAIVGILIAMLVPSWTAFVQTWTLNAAQERIFMVMRDAQGNARLSHVPWQASFRELNGIVQWTTHSATADPAIALWQSLDPKIRIDQETTLLSTNGVYRVRFDEDGNVKGQLGRLTLSGKAGGRSKRCVVVSTLIGALRRGRDNPSMQDGKYCY